MLKLIMITFVFFSIAAQGALDEWQTIESQECGFTALMPGKGAISKDKPDYRSESNVVGGGFQLKTYTYDTADSTESYTISCSIFPENYFSLIDKAEFLEGGMQRFGEKALRSKKLELEGHVGLEYVVEMIPETSYVYYRVYVVNEKVFLLSVDHRGKEIKEQEHKKLHKFFASLDLVE